MGCALVEHAVGYVAGQATWRGCRPGAGVTGGPNPNPKFTLRPHGQSETPQSPSKVFVYGAGFEAAWCRRLKSKPLLGVESSRGCATYMMDWNALRHGEPSSPSPND
jgi:hypothetical protein